MNAQNGMPPQPNPYQQYPPQFPPQMQRPPQQPPQKKKKKPASFWVVIITAIIALIAVVVICLFAFQSCEGGPLYDDNAASGQLEGKTPEEIQAELDRQVEEGMFNISIASVVEFADGDSEGELRIENVPGNRYDMQVTIADDSTGEVYYQTNLIRPDQHIQKDKLLKDLDPGTYECTAVFTAFDPETNEEVGQAAAKMTISVLS